MGFTYKIPKHGLFDTTPSLGEHVASGCGLFTRQWHQRFAELSYQKMQFP